MKPYNKKDIFAVFNFNQPIIDDSFKYNTKIERLKYNTKIEGFKNVNLQAEQRLRDSYDRDLDVEVQNHTAMKISMTYKILQNPEILKDMRSPQGSGRPQDEEQVENQIELINKLKSEYLPKFENKMKEVDPFVDKQVEEHIKNIKNISNIDELQKGKEMLLDPNMKLLLPYNDNQINRLNEASQNRINELEQPSESKSEPEQPSEPKQKSKSKKKLKRKKKSKRKKKLKPVEEQRGFCTIL